MENASPWLFTQPRGGKVFSSPSPSGGRTEGAAASRGMLYMKGASLPPPAVPRDCNLAIPRRCSPGAAPRSRGAALPGGGSPAPRGGSGAGGHQVSLQARAWPRRRASGTGAARREPGETGGTSWRWNLVPPPLPTRGGGLEVFCWLSGSAQSQTPRSVCREGWGRDAGQEQGGHRGDAGGMRGEDVNRADTAPLEPSSCGYLSPGLGLLFL